METTISGARRSGRWKGTAGIACMVSSAVIFLGTSFVSPGAQADNGVRSEVVVGDYLTDGLGKRDSLAEVEMLIQKEVLIADGSASDADPAGFVTPSIDTFLNPSYVRRYNVTDTTVPTIREGDSATFRIRVYPRRLEGNNPLGSLITATDTANGIDVPGCAISEPTAVPAEGNLVFTCTISDLRSKGPGLGEDFINTITVTRTDLDGTNPITQSESAAINVVAPCISIVKNVRQAGTTGPWLPAQDPANAAIIATGATAEYQIIVNNCGEMNLSGVAVTDTISGCSRVIGDLPVGAAVTYTTADAGLTGCSTTPVASASCSRATVVGQPMIGTLASGATIQQSDPACIKPPVVTPTVAPTLAPTTVAPTTLAPTTLAPTTVTPTTLAPTTVPFVIPPAAPCLTLKTFVRAAGSTDPWQDANNGTTAATIAFNGAAEYQFDVVNCGTVTLSEVVVTSPTTGCNRVIGTLSAGQRVTYNSSDPGTTGCRTQPAINDFCLTATATGNTGPNTATLSATDPACIRVLQSGGTPSSVVAKVLAQTPPAPTPSPTPSPTTVAAPSTTLPAPPVVQVLDSTVSASTETEELSQTGSTTTPMVMFSAILMALGLGLLLSNRPRTVSGRHFR